MPAWSLGLEVVSHYLFKGARDWSRPFRVLVLGDEDLEQLSTLTKQLDAAQCPYEVLYAHQDQDFVDKAAARMAAAAEASGGAGRVDLRRLPEGPLDPAAWGVFDYIAVRSVGSCGAMTS